MQPTTVLPTLTSRMLGHTTGLVQPAGTQPSELIGSTVPPEELVVLMYIGRFQPSTIDTSENSRASQASKWTSARVAGIVPQPLHWNSPPQSPVWQWPTPALSKTQPVRPQNRVLRLFGVVMVTLCPAGSI